MADRETAGQRLTASSDTDSQALHTHLTVAHQIIVRSVMLYTGSYPVWHIIAAICHQGLNGTTAAVVEAAAGFISAGSVLPQLLRPQNRLGDVTDAVLHIGQFLHDPAQFIQKKQLLAVLIVDFQSAQVIIPGIGGVAEQAACPAAIPMPE